MTKEEILEALREAHDDGDPYEAVGRILDKEKTEAITAQQYTDYCRAYDEYQRAAQALQAAAEPMSMEMRDKVRQLWRQSNPGKAAL